MPTAHRQTSNPSGGRPDAKTSKGRPRQEQVDRSILDKVLEEISTSSYESITIEKIAKSARTSKQAIYRRHKDKSALVAAALEEALQYAHPRPPQRGSVAQDLSAFLTGLTGSLAETPLGGAMRALLPYRCDEPFQTVFDEAEDHWKLNLRQIFIATPFDAHRETRIDLLLGLVYARCVVAPRALEQSEIDTAIQLVLGLTAPRDPV